jgi:hypothetical protein
MSGRELVSRSPRYSGNPAGEGVTVERDRRPTLGLTLSQMTGRVEKTCRPGCSCLAGLGYCDRSR